MTVINSEDDVTSWNDCNSAKIDSKLMREVVSSRIKSHGHNTIFYNTIKFEQRRMVIGKNKSKYYTSPIPKLSHIKKRVVSNIPWGTVVDHSLQNNMTKRFNQNKPVKNKLPLVRLGCEFLLEFLVRVVFSWRARLCSFGVRSIWNVTETVPNSCPLNTMIRCARIKEEKNFHVNDSSSVF
jgi:hypothetical protein